MRLEYFRMVDRVATLDVEAGHILAECVVPDQSPVFEGHFPGYPILPGTLMIEAMAQTGGWLVLALHRFTRMAFLIQVEKAKIRTFVSPGSRLLARANLEHDGSGYAVAKTSLSMEGKKVADAEIRFGVQPYPKAEMVAARSVCRRSCCVAHDRDVLITGMALASCLGTTLDEHWAALNRPGGFVPVVDTDTFAPFLVHPIVPLDLDQQISKRDQRQMEAWQRIGTFTAGVALESAGLKGDADRLAKTDMIIAAGGGERDYATDSAILSGYHKAAEPAVFLNQQLAGGLRPTLFLAQLSNLLAGGIGIAHGIGGASRTFMGEEASGAAAVRSAHARIAAGQADTVLVGGSYNAQRPDVMLHFQMNGLLRQNDFDGIWSRQASGGGMILGSVGCFLVLEGRKHATQRGASAFARIAGVQIDRTRRESGQATAKARAQIDALRFDAANAAVVSGACGTADATREEHALLAGLGLPVRAAATAIGHSVEPSFPASLALAALALRHGRLFDPLEPSESDMTGALSQVLVTSWGQWRGEAMALLQAV
jgi:3-oxoacyl-[acyl-carrier-protein] synthase II